MPAKTELPTTGPLTPEPLLLHGGGLDEARRRFPKAPEPWIDLSTGINPISYPIPDLPPEAWARLPTRSDEHALLRAAAQRYGAADPQSVIAAPGTQALIQLIPRLFPPSRVAIVGPTYGEHKACWSRQGHQVTAVRDLDEGAGKDVLVLVNPNNPTGRTIPASELRALAESLAGKKSLLVVDEAFIDVLPGNASLAGRLPPATLVLRSFGKTYGLAGLRLGFAIAERALAQRLRAELGPWAVSGPAIEIGKAALADTRWLEQTNVRLEADQQRLAAMLQTAGFVRLGGTPLFQLVSHADAASMIDSLGGHGIHVRRFPEEPGWIRFGLPGDAFAWDRLARAIEP